MSHMTLRQIIRAAHVVLIFVMLAITWWAATRGSWAAVITGVWIFIQIASVAQQTRRIRQVRAEGRRPDYAAIARMEHQLGIDPPKDA